MCEPSIAKSFLSISNAGYDFPAPWTILLCCTFHAVPAKGKHSEGMLTENPHICMMFDAPALIVLIKSLDLMPLSLSDVDHVHLKLGGLVRKSGSAAR
jgi:hypothetical protein